MTDIPGEDVNKWLSKVTIDQNLEELGQADDGVLTGIRRWFASRILTPMFNMGYYDSSTGKIVLGESDVTLANANINNFFEKYNLNDIELLANNLTQAQLATSAQDHTFTVPANKTWIVHSATSTNLTRAGALLFLWEGTSYTVSEQTATAAGEYCKLIGGSGNQDSTTGGASHNGPFIANEGDVLHFYDGNFVASDGRRTYVIYSEFSE